MGYRDAITHGETNVGLGMVSGATEEDRLEQEIDRLRDRLAAIERQVIYRTADMPEWAVAWNKAASGRYCWFVGLHIAQEADNPTPQPAPDLRPDEPGPLWLPIIDAPDAGKGD